MAWIGEKSGTGAHASEMAAFAFDAQILFEFLALDMTGLDGQGGVQTLQRLDASHAHRYSSHAQQALVLPHRPRTPCRSARRVQWGRREGE
jgi:hypothetical protein